MNISQVGVNLIKSFEGLRLSAYKPVPTEQYWTIGYGHYGADVSATEKWTASKAEDMLKSDLKVYADGVNKVLTHSVNQNQFDALVSFAYNLGVTALKTSTLLKLLNKGDFIGASNEFEKWVHSNGNVLQGLVTRRKAEKALFLKPVNEPVYYTVVKGDNATAIAKRKGTTLQKLDALNPSVKDWNKIYVGQKLRIK
jgi:lysozyme